MNLQDKANKYTNTNSHALWTGVLKNRTRTYIFTIMDIFLKKYSKMNM